MLIIRHLTGPLAGTEQRIEPNVDRVVFGRQLDCQVVYPADANIVARHHFALERRASGDWTIDLFGQPFVAVNGIPADPGAKMPPGATFELGRRGGPSFQVATEAEARTDNLPPTAPQEEDEGARAMAVRAGRTALGAQRIAALGLALAVAAGAAGYYYYYRPGADAARVEQAIARFYEAAARDANTRIGADVRARLARAAYVVMRRDARGRHSGVGTAWPVGPHLLGTNAHVAAARDGLGPGEALVVRAPGPNGNLYMVTQHKIHPGYSAFAAFVRDDPLVLGGFRGRDQFVNINSFAYDVAYLRVNEALPADAILEMAETSELEALAAGTAVATAGYPMENVVGSVALTIQASPELHVGTVTGVTDFFSLPADFDQRRMVHHDLPTTGGQSGSPIVGPSGHVVALLNSSNMFRMEGGRRIPSAALISYGQRVDLLRSLISGQAESQLARDRTYWAQQIAPFTRGIDHFIPFMLTKLKPSADATPALINQKIITLGAETRIKRPNGQVQRQSSQPLSLAAGNYVLIVYAQRQAHVQLYLMADKKVLAKETEGKWYPAISHAADAQTDASLWVISPNDVDIACTLRVYRWQTNGPSG
jgi:Trypsin-like peptidase domain